MLPNIWLLFVYYFFFLHELGPHVGDRRCQRIVAEDRGSGDRGTGAEDRTVYKVCPRRSARDLSAGKSFVYFAGALVFIVGSCSCAHVPEVAFGRV